MKKSNAHSRSGSTKSCEETDAGGSSPDKKARRDTLKFNVCLASNGIEHEITVISHATTVLYLQKEIQRRTSLPVEDHIVLFGPPFKRLSSSKPLKLAVGKDIFVFDRKKLCQNEMVEIPRVKIGPLKLASPSIVSDNPELNVSSSPILRVLSDYALQYLHDLETARAHQRGNRDLINACFESVRQQKNIRRAWNAATSNLQRHCEVSNNKFKAFSKKFREQQVRQAKFLAGFDDSLQRLCRVHLHPKLKSEERSSLIDCVPVNRLKRWASECTHSQELLQSKLADLDQVYRATTDGVRQLRAPRCSRRAPNDGDEKKTVKNSDECDGIASSNSCDATANESRASVNARNSGEWSISEFRGGGEGESGAANSEDEAAAAAPAPTTSKANSKSTQQVSMHLVRKIEDGSALLERQQREVLDALERDYRDILASIACEKQREDDDSTHEDAHPSVRSLCDVLEIKHQKHQDEMLPKLYFVDRSIEQLCRLCADEHTAMMQRMQKQMYLVSVLQSRIREQGQRLGAMRAALEQLVRGTNELKHVERMPSAYVAALTEVILRRAFKRKYVAELERVFDRLAKMIDNECTRRETFAKAHGGHLPPNLLLGLADRPAYCDIRMRQFDGLLPDIDDFSVKDLFQSRDLDENPSIRVASDGLAEENAIDGEDASDRATGRGSLVLEGKKRKTNAVEPAEGTAMRCAELECENATLRAKLKQMEALNRMRDPSVAFVGGEDSVVTKSGSAAKVAVVAKEARSELKLRRVEPQERAKACGDASSTGVEGDIDMPFVMELTTALGLGEVEQHSDSAADTESVDIASAKSRLLASVRSLRSSHESQLDYLFTQLSKGLGTWQKSDTESAERKEASNSDVLAIGCQNRRRGSYSQIVQMIATLRGQERLRQAEIVRKDKEIEKAKESAASRIAYRDFGIGNVALFLPAKVDYNVQRTIYVAFHHMCPRRFLSEACVAKLSQSGQAPDFVLGRITKLEAHVAIEEDNEYSAPLGATYYIADVDPIAGSMSYKN